MQFVRDDIYFCKGCGRFFDNQTDEVVEIALHLMPAETALTVLHARRQKFQFCHIQKCLRAERVKNKKRRKSSN